MFILIVAIVFLIFLLRSKDTNIKKLTIQTGKHEQDSPISSVKFYLTAEAKLTELRFNQLYKEEDLNAQEFIEPDWLALRQGFLEIEKEFLLNEDRLDHFWTDVGDKFKALLKERHLVKRIKSLEIKETDSEEQVDMKELLKMQFDALEELAVAMDTEKTAEEIEVLNTKMLVAIRTHTELSHCVNMIGDENEFLGNQINELLKRPV